MDIETIRMKKKELAEEIIALAERFKQETGVGVLSAGYSRVDGKCYVVLLDVLDED